MVELALGSLLLVIFITVFGSYYETAINKVIDLAAVGIVKLLGALQNLKLPTEPEEKKEK